MTEEVIRFANKNWSVQRNCCADSSSLAQQVDGDLPSGIPEPSPLCWVLTGKAFALLAEQIAEFDRFLNELYSPSLYIPFAQICARSPIEGAPFHRVWQERNQGMARQSRWFCAAVHATCPFQVLLPSIPIFNLKQAAWVSG